MLGVGRWYMEKNP